MGFTRTELIVTCTIFLLLIALLLPAVQQARESARRTQSRNNLKQIGLALQNYDETFQVLPAGGMYNGEGRGMFGWMVSIAPYMDASPLYSQLDMHQPWDSIRNAGVLLQRYPSYEIPGEETQIAGWNFPVAHYSANSHVLGANRWMPLDTVSSKGQVFLVGELGGDFVPWACPYNWRPLTTLNGKPTTYGRYSGDGAYFFMGDGHVEFVTDEAFQTRRESLAGDDLAEARSLSGMYPRPIAFPVPDDALRPTAIQFAGDRWADARQNKSGEIVRLWTRGWDKREAVRVTAADISQIATYRGLEELSLFGDFAAADLQPLLGLNRLKYLTLESEQLRADGLEVLNSLPQLQRLNVRGGWVNSDEIQRLQNLLPRFVVTSD